MSFIQRARIRYTEGWFYIMQQFNGHIICFSGRRSSHWKEMSNTRGRSYLRGFGSAMPHPLYLIRRAHFIFLGAHMAT